MRDPGFGCFNCGGEGGERFLHQSLMSDTGKKSSLELRTAVAANVAQYFSTQIANSFTSER